MHQILKFTYTKNTKQVPSRKSDYKKCMCTKNMQKSWPALPQTSTDHSFKCAFFTETLFSTGSEFETIDLLFSFGGKTFNWVSINM